MDPDTSMSNSFPRRIKLSSGEYVSVRHVVNTSPRLGSHKPCSTSQESWIERCRGMITGLFRRVRGVLTSSGAAGMSESRERKK